MTVKWGIYSVESKVAVAYVSMTDGFISAGLRALHTTLQCGDRVVSSLARRDTAVSGTLMSPFHFGSKQLAVVVWDDDSAGLWLAKDLRRA